MLFIIILSVIIIVLAIIGSHCKDIPTDLH